MAQTQFKDMIAPAYLADFSCLGTDCSDNCCHGWHVHVDHESYTRIKNLPGKEIKVLVTKTLLRGTGKSGSADFGSLKLTDDSARNCGFLAKDGLCALQKKCGEVILPDVCTTYPRVTKSVSGVLEQFASPSCPEIARLVVENPAALSLQQQRLPIRSSMVVQITATSGSDVEASIRALFLAVLSADDVALWQKLSLLLLMAESIDAVYRNKPADPKQAVAVMESTLQDWTDQLTSGQAMLALDGWQRHEALHIKTMAAASRVRAEKGSVRPRYQELIEEALAGLGYQSDLTQDVDQVISSRFAEARLSLATQAALNRILLNYALSRHFPFVNGMVWDVKELCLQYLLLRFWLVGLTQSRQRELSSAELVEMVYLFYRAIMHHASYTSACMTELESAGLMKPEHWLLLLPD